MVSLILPIGALLTGVALLLLGGGLLGTLLVVRGAFEGFGAQTIGLIMSGYFVGFLVGTYLAPALIRRIGHIRAFAFYAAACASLVLVHALIVAPIPWLLLRVLTGIGLVGLYMVIESWLNAQAPNDRRGQVFAFYMAVNLLALAAGQQFLRMYSIEAFALFAIVAMLISASVLPVTWTRLPQPALPAATRLRVREVMAQAPSAVSGAFLSGLAMSAFWGLGPLFVTGIGLGEAMVASFMTATILGGAVLQWPLGWLSDRIDRRLAMAVVAALAALVALAALPGLGRHPIWLLTAFFLYGGLAFTAYPIAVAHLMDRIQSDQMLAASSTVLLIHGLGATLGPALAGWLLERHGPTALPWYFATCFAALAVLALQRWRFGRPTEPQAAHCVPMLRTTPTALEMHPDIDEEQVPAQAGTLQRG